MRHLIIDETTNIIKWVAEIDPTHIDTKPEYGTEGSLKPKFDIFMQPLTTRWITPNGYYIVAELVLGSEGELWNQA